MTIQEFLLRLTINRSTWTRVPTLHEYKFHYIPPSLTVRTYLRGYISIAKGASVCFPPFPPPFVPQLFSIGARILVPVVFRVDGVQSDRYCLDCKFFACISIEPERRSMGGTSCKFRRPYPPASVFACSTNLNDKCTYLLTTVRLIC